MKTAYHQHVSVWVLSCNYTSVNLAEEREIEEKALNFLGVWFEDRDELAMNLPYGEQRRLEIASFSDRTQIIAAG